jgi:DNA-binding NtrC family response regulator
MHISSVLIVDDEAAVLDLLGQLFGALGMQTVCQASSAEEAMDVLKVRQFDLIVSDYRMQGMDGVEFLSRLRAQGDLTPMIMLSGAPDQPGVIRAAHHPNVYFFGKPFRIEEIQCAMGELMQLEHAPDF